LKKPIILVDTDDTIIHHANPLVEYLNYIYQKTYKVEDIEGYQVWKLYGITYEAFWHELNTFFRSDYYFQSSFVENSIKTLQDLASDFRLVMCTSRSLAWQGPTMELFEDRGILNLFEEFYFGGDYGPGENAIPKYQNCLKAGASLIVDDYPKAVNACLENGIPSILFGNYPWNHEILSVSGGRRAWNWQEVPQKVQEILLTAISPS